MNKFEQELKKNNLLCSRCTKCNKLVWPPSDFCNNCFGEVIWQPISRNAKIVEFSRKNNKYFCIAEFEEGVRVMGSVENASNLHIGQSLILVKCDYDVGEKFVFEPFSGP
jgi:uncharacterized protein